MAFDPTTAYRLDYQWLHFSEDATLELPNETETPDQITGLKVQRGDLNAREFQSLAAGLALSSSAAAFIVYPPIDPATNQQLDLGLYQGCLLRIVEADTVTSEELLANRNVGWLIQAYERTRFGHYLMVCDKELVNVTT